jgi:peptidoglycan/xylan/chitin deacetylase (PgdA/CDA1 family)
MSGLSPTARAFVRTHVANVLGFPADAAVLGRDLEVEIFRELSRTTEVETPARDAWGNWEFSFGESNLSGQLYRPWLDRPLAALRERLTAEHPDRLPEPLWPDGRPFAVCLTHDMDFVTLQPSFARSRRTIARNTRSLLRPGGRATAEATLRGIAVAAYQIASLKVLRPRSERTYDEWLKLEDRYGFKSTFFCFPETVSAPHVYDCLYAYDDPVVFDGRRMKVRDMMREMVRSGWDIGLHGSYHSALRGGLLAEQRRVVEDAIGRPVIATRQHWLHYDARVTPRLQSDAGLLADSTQGFNRNVGFRAGTSFPYACWDLERGAELPVLEVPQHVMDGALFTANALEYDVELAVRHCVRLLDEVQAVGGCLTLSWHPDGIQVPKCWTVYETVLAEASRRGAWGCSVGDLYRWWTGRAERIAARPPVTRG